MKIDEQIIQWGLEELQAGRTAGRVRVAQEFDLGSHNARRHVEVIQREHAKLYGDLSSSTLGGQSDQELDESVPGAPAGADPVQESLCRMILETPLEEAAPVEGLLESMISYQQKLLSHERRQETVQVTVDTDLPIMLIPRGDWHIANVNTDHVRWMEDNRLIADRSYCKTIESGDFIDGAILASMPELQQEQLAPVKLQRKIVWWVFFTLDHRTHCLALIHGQHDAWAKAQADFSPIEWLSHSLHERGYDIPFLGWGGCVYLTVGKQLYKILVRHGYKFNSSVNASHSVKQLMRMGDHGFGDIGIVADQHVWDVECCRLAGKPTLLARPGTYKPEDAFSARKGFNKSDPFMPGVILWPDRRCFVAHYNFRQLLPLIDAFHAGKIDWRDPLFEATMGDLSAPGLEEVQQE